MNTRKLTGDMPSQVERDRDELIELRDKCARQEQMLNECDSDANTDYGHIIKFWETHTAPGNPHHSIHEWLEWLWSEHDQLVEMREVLSWASENVVSARFWSEESEWRVLCLDRNYDEPTIYAALHSAWSNRKDKP